MKLPRTANAVAFLEDDLIAEAAKDRTEGKRKRPVWMRWGAIAACAALVAAVGIGVFQSGLFGPKTDVCTFENGESICFRNSKDPVGQSDLDGKWANTRALTDDELHGLFPNLPVKAYGFFHTNGQAIALEGSIDGIKLVVWTPEAGNRMDTEIAGEESESMVGGIPIHAGYFLTKANSKGIKTAIYYATFVIGENTVYVEYAGQESERDRVKNALADTVFRLVENGELELGHIQE